MKSINNKQFLFKVSALAMSGALVMSASSVASAADIKISGWLFETAVDRDSADDIEYQTLGNAGNFIAFDATQDLGNGLTAGINLRFGSFGGNSSSVDQKSIRLSGGFGTLDLGQNVSASNFADSYDGSPTYWFDPMGWYNILSATGSGASFDAFNRFAGLGSSARTERLRYTSPTFSGVTLNLQSGDNGSNEVAVSYNDHGVIANAFVVNDGNSETENISSFLLGYNSPIGLFASIVNTTQDQAAGGENQITGYKVGYTAGKHTVSYSAHTYETAGAANDFERSNLSYVYAVNSKVQVFAQYGDEEEGAIDDSALAIGAGVFF